MSDEVQDASVCCSLAFGRRLRQVGIAPSMGSAGDALDNAVAESFFGTLKRELVHRHRFSTRAAAKTAVFDYIECFYNRRRLHSTIGQLSPAEFERRYAVATATYPEPVHGTGASSVVLEVQGGVPGIVHAGELGEPVVVEAGRVDMGLIPGLH